METLTQRLIDAQVRTLADWQREHADAMAGHDVDELFAKLHWVWREICADIDESAEHDRTAKLEWLVRERIYTRLRELTEHAVSVALRTDYFKRDFRFSQARIQGFLAALGRAEQAGRPSQRASLELDLGKLPPRMPTDS